jgi:hypothetical protein
MHPFKLHRFRKRICTVQNVPYNSLMLNVFRVDPEKAAITILENGVSPSKKGVKANTLQDDVPSLSTSATTIYSLKLSKLITNEHARVLIQKWLPMNRSQSRYYDSPDPRSSWTSGISAFAAAIARHNSTERRLMKVLQFQSSDGSWKYSDSDSGERGILYSFYPVLALCSYAKTCPNDLFLKHLVLTYDYLSQQSTDVLSLKCIRVFLLDLISHYIGLDTTANDNQIRLTSSLLVESARLNTQISEPSYPLFFVNLFEPAMYNIVRLFVPPDHLLSLRLMARLRTFSYDEKGFTAYHTNSQLSTWATALGILAAARWLNDVAKSSKNLERLSSKVARLSIIEKDGRPYHFAISYARPNESIAKEIYRRLSQRYKVYLDDVDRHETMGEKLDQKLHQLYLEDCECGIIVSSYAYLRSRWTREIEYPALIEKVIAERGARLFIYRIDEASLPKLPCDLSYLDARVYTVESFCNIASNKVDEFAYER